MTNFSFFKEMIKKDEYSKANVNIFTSSDKFASIEEASMYFSEVRPSVDVIMAFHDKDINRLNELKDEYAEWHENPIKRAQFEFTNYQNRWKLEYDSNETLESIRKKALVDDPIIMDHLTDWYHIKGDTLVHCMLGTSNWRANAWARGTGVVWLEGMTESGEGIGLQVNCPSIDGTRATNDRIRYYAMAQAGKIADSPVILEFNIPAKYIYCQGNKGEFAVPQSAYSYVKDIEITSIDL